ncbi:YceI family protein [Jeongeupia chitinilytica]|uniref:Polyisoprenoid-binding protein n=1 Tax=Jeongeupia chitinilytica TaxID=1041641 RepID=A0ABQ3H4Q4_9NEIS|nr:YceI family protein [Jeongeupia chitinilytica]GHD68401.1 polyisoprenoid-binding protein [Jeongeupia chitinilytica]
MKKLILAAAFATVASAAFAAPETYSIDPSHTAAHFSINHLGFSTQQGTFDKTSGSIVLDAEKKSGSVDISIDTASLDTGWDARDKHLKGEDFFNVEKYPTATFKSKNFKFDGDKLVAVDGDFTLLGVTKPLTLSVADFKCGPHPMMKKPWCGAAATAVLKRSDFGMKAYLPAVGDEVKLTIQVEAGKQ